MRVPTKVRKEKIQEVRTITQAAISGIRSYEKYLYESATQTIGITPKDFNEIVYTIIKEGYKIAIKEWKKLYTIDEASISMSKMILKVEEHEVEKKVKHFYDMYYNKNKSKEFFRALCVIAETEIYNIVMLIRRYRFKENEEDIDYIEFFSDDCKCVCGCHNKMPEGVREIKHITEWPPFHPGCKCGYVLYKKDEVKDDLRDKLFLSN